METATRVAKPLLVCAKGAEVFGCRRYDVAVELKDDSSRCACAGQGSGLR